MLIIYDVFRDSLQKNMHIRMDKKMDPNSEKRTQKGNYCTISVNGDFEAN